MGRGFGSVPIFVCTDSSSSGVGFGGVIDSGMASCKDQKHISALDVERTGGTCMGVKKALTIFVIAANVLLHAAAPVTLRVTPAFQFAPGYVRLTLVVEPDKVNRGYCLFWEGPNAGSQCRDLQGDREPRTRWVDLKDMPAGEYVAVLSVAKSDGGQARSAEVKWEILEGVPRG